ncbi:MAG: nitroreductase [Desulfomonilaceae bacterium]
MDVIDTIRNRKSARAFSDEPLSRQLLEKVLRDASRAPSAINMQPWEVHMVLGEEARRLSRRLMRSFRERGLTCGPGSSRPLPDRFIQRARECGDGMSHLLETMGTDLSTFVNEGSLNFYGAPAVALIFLDDAFPSERMADIGVFMAYLLLASSSYGLASCPIGLVKSYEDEVKDHLNIPESKILVISVALGRPKPGVPINEFRSSRADPNEFVRWID